MSILWCGGEDIDFPNGVTPLVDGSATFRRAGYARCSLGTNGSTDLCKSVPFPGGAVTSCWFTARVYPNISFGSTPKLAVGLGLSGTAKGLYVGASGGNTTKLALNKYNGTTATELATEAGNSITQALHRLDVQLVNYGSSATVNVYWDGALVITFSGDVSVSGVTNLDSIFFNGGGSATYWNLSEVVVADEDVRAFPGLVTLALTGAGTTDDWTGTYSNINGTTISDANPAYVNVNAKDEQFNVTDLPTGTFVIKAVKIAARMAKSNDGPAVTQVKLGYNSGGSTGFGTGATKALTTAYATYEQLDLTNPVSSAAFVQSEMNALQLDMQSVT